MIPIKSKEEIASMREACRVAATVLSRLREMVAPGVNTYDLDQAGREFMRELGAKSACHNYRTGRLVFPAHTCLSVNDEVVHGIGKLQRVLEDGDVISLDVVVEHDGFIGDNAATVAVGEVNGETARLLKVTEESLAAGIAVAREGKRVGDISSTVQRYVESRGFSVVRQFVGHGVGRSMHEEPQIPNFGRKGTGPKLRAGMTLAIEPMVNQGGSSVRVLPDGWTVVTEDGTPSAHFEHTVLITSGEPEILTQLKF